MLVLAALLQPSINLGTSSLLDSSRPGLIQAPGVTSVGQSLVTVSGSDFTRPTGISRHIVMVDYTGGAHVNDGQVALQPDAYIPNIATITRITAHSPDPSTFGQAVTITARVSASIGIPSGNVTFYDGLSGIGTTSLDVVGNATLVTALLDVGVHALKATYAGNGPFTASSSAVATQTVNQAAPNENLVVSQSTSVFGAPLYFTTTVTSTVGVPTGTVDFNDGAMVIGSSSLSNGVATLTSSSIGAGIHSIAASYGGDAHFGAALSPAVVVTVSKAAAGVFLAASPTAAIFGSPFFLTATVTSAAGVPTGTVDLEDGSLVIGTRALIGGSATFTSTVLGVGTHTLTASYGGNANISAGSSSGVLVTVTQATASAGLAVSQLTPVYGAPLYLTATVTSTAGVPTGTVYFKDDASVLGSGPLNGGVALLTVPALNAGGHTLSAEYGGNANLPAASSNTIVVKITKASSSLLITTASPDTSTVGQPVDIHFSVNAIPTGGAPTGVVTVSTTGLSCTSTLPASACDITFSATGVWTLTATYGGDANFQGSVSPPFAHTVRKQYVYLPTIIRSPPPVNPCGTPQLTWHGGQPAGTIINALYLPPGVSSKIVYAGAATAPGAYVSRDGGLSWPDSGIPVPVLAFAANPFISTTVYAGTYGGGIYQTTNAGASWMPMSSSPWANVWSLAAISTSGSAYKLLAGTGNGVYYWNSILGTWSVAGGPIAGKIVYALVVDPSNGDVYAATSGSGVYKSTDSGSSFVQTALNNVSVFALATTPSHVVYAGLNGQGVSLSANGGASWQAAGAGIGSRSVYALAFDPADPLRLFAGTIGGGIYTSLNGATSWNPYNAGLSQSNAYALAFDPDCYGTLLAGTGSGVWQIDTRQVPQ